jgi:hypothetical protein
MDHEWFLAAEARILFQQSQKGFGAAAAGKDRQAGGFVDCYNRIIDVQNFI